MKTIFTKLIFLLCLLWLPSTAMFGQDETATTDDLLNMSLEDLMNVKINVGSKTQQTIQETPSIVSLITSDDIERNHCRDMVDVLNMVPGFNITKDDDYTSFSSRGLYGYEGRTLIMVDGMQLSDLYFGAYIIGNDFPIHLVKRIEIIRGPGSVIYGGTAELAVINIVTSDGKDIDGVQITARDGQLPSTFGHRDIGFTMGHSFDKFEYSLLGFVGEAMRSDGVASYIGKPTQYNHNYNSAGLASGAVLLKAVYNENTVLTAAYNSYQNNQVRSFTIDPNDPKYSTFNNAVDTRKVSYLNTNITGNIYHNIKLNNITITPGYSHQYSYPLNRTPEREEVYIQRFKPYVYGVYSLDKLEVTLGGEYFIDNAKINRPDPNDPSDYLRKSITDAGKDELNIASWASYTNVKYNILDDETKLFINGGLRYDNNELYGDKLSPRAALNFLVGKFHSKLLYSSAFRAPLVANNAFSRYGLNPDPALNSRPSGGVEPEDTKVYELEVGYKLTDNLMLTANGFYQEVNNIIEFRYDYNNGDLFSDNGGKIGTYGIESELRYVSPKYNGLLNMSWVQPKFFSDVNPLAYAYNDAKGGDTYITPDTDADGNPINLNLLGVSAIKLYTNQSFNITDKLIFGVNGLYLSDKWTYDGNGKSRKLGEQFILGYGLTYKIENFVFVVSVHDALNKRQNIATAWYDGSYEVLPYKGREISLTVRANF